MSDALPRLSRMDLIMIIGIVVAALAVVALVYGVMQAVRPKVPEASSASAGAAPVLAPEVVARIDDLVRSGNTIAAIKVLRDHTGESLQSSKRRIQRWTVGAAPATTAIPIFPPTIEDPAEVRAGLAPAAASEVDRLVAADQQIAAIKLLRTEAGLGLKQAKDAIDAWPR